MAIGAASLFITLAVEVVGMMALLVLTLLGFALIGAGVWWSKHEAELSAKFRSLLPHDLRELLEARQIS